MVEDGSGTSHRLAVAVLTVPAHTDGPPPEWYVGIDDIALSYLQLVEQRGLRDVLVVGSSIGGWIASAMAVREHERISGTVLLDAVGIKVEGIELADFFSLTPQELIAYSFHDPTAAPDPTQLPQEARNIQAANAATLAVYAREPHMHDPRKPGISPTSSSPSGSSRRSIVSRTRRAARRSPSAASAEPPHTPGVGCCPRRAC